MDMRQEDRTVYADLRAPDAMGLTASVELPRYPHGSSEWEAQRELLMRFAEIPLSIRYPDGEPEMRFDARNEAALKIFVDAGYSVVSTVL